MKDIKQQGIETRQRIYDFIIQYISDHGYSPTVREIAAGSGLKSTSSTHAHLKTMQQEGKIETDAGFNSPRAIRVTGYRFMREEP